MSRKRMTILRLERADTETLGVLLLDGKLVCFTLEPPWKDNQPEVSCIPFGRYRCKESYYYEGGHYTWEVSHVFGRSHIKIHTGNTVDDTEGCILVGTYPGRLEGKRAVLASKQAFDKLSAKLRGVKEFDLDIKEV